MISMQKLNNRSKSVRFMKRFLNSDIKLLKNSIKTSKALNQNAWFKLHFLSQKSFFLQQSYLFLKEAVLLLKMFKFLWKILKFYEIFFWKNYWKTTNQIGWNKLEFKAKIHQFVSHKLSWAIFKINFAHKNILLAFYINQNKSILNLLKTKNWLLHSI